MTRPLLMVSESMRNADMYYATRFLATDPFIYLSIPREERELLIVSQMEFERARKESRVKEIRSSLAYGYDLKMEELIFRVLQKEGIEAIEVPGYFPLYLAEELRKRGIDVVPVEEVIITRKREVKDQQELTYMRRAQRACENALACALAVITRASVKGEFLVENGELLTSERIKATIEHALIDSGCTLDSGEPIVACGAAAADPHYTGQGPLRAHEPIIIDIFPRLKVARYCADMSRTVSKGEPTREITEMYDAVKHAQDAAVARVRAGVTCKEVHSLVCDLFEERGYETIRKGGKKGFIHSTGHGVGLNVHENPRVGENEYILKKGNVITIEPGLYEPGVGGVRLEDMVLVLDQGCENLTRFVKELVL